MHILEFVEIFPTEESCKLHFKEQRERIGITCQKCGCKKTLLAKIKVAMAVQ